MRASIAVLFLLILSVVTWHGVRPVAAQTASSITASTSKSIDGLQAVTLVFGSKDAEPTVWDGRASLSTGTIEKIEGYHFTREEKINGNSWECSTHAWSSFRHEMDPQERPQPRATPLEVVGVTIYYRASADAELHVKFTPKLTPGLYSTDEFSVRLGDIPQDGSIYPFSARVEVRHAPIVQSITESQYEDDYPSVAADGNSVWVAWLAFQDKADRVFLRRYRNGHWDEPLTVTEKPGDLFMTGLAASGGKVTVVWSEYEANDAWHLKARTYDGANFGPLEMVTSGTGKSLFHRVAADSNGGVHVAYQSWRNGRSDIYLRSRSADKWLPEMLLSDPKRDVRANDWDGAVAAGHDGTVWVAWDGYATGNYELYLRRVAGGKPGPVIRVTNSTRFHAHPSLAVDVQNRLWIAYDEAPENWGKDSGFLFTGGTGLYEARTVKVAVYSPAGRFQTPLRQPDDVVPYGFKRYLQTPRLVAASDGRIWLFMRPRTEARFPTSLWAAGGKWEVCGTYYSGDRWSDLKMFPNSVGRNEGELAAAADANGNAWVALNTDQKFWGGPEFGEKPGNNDIMVARVEGGSAPTPVLADRPTESPAGLSNEPEEKNQIAALRSYVVQANGAKYKIYRGDLHRHTEISLDGAGDGTLWDAYRYAMDAAGLDFVVVTDHQSGDQEYPWWRIQKSADMFDVPGFFAGVYGTERSVNYPNGHRNLMFTKRGVPILNISQQEMQGKVNTGPILYPFLKKYNGIATPHSPTTGMGTDWRDNDPTVDPIVELWEGSRTSAEHEGAPLAPTSKKTEMWAGGYKPLGFVWNAWSKGYKLGVQASSDHASTHLSYTAVIAENGSREALVDAMRKRHTYAATRNILLDYRMNVEGKTYIQGDELSSGSMPELKAHIVGAGPLKNVVIVRDNQYIYTTEPRGETCDLNYTERSLTPGQHYYYVRVEQKDRNMAWSSPIWIHYGK